jgi:ribosomal protein L29
MKKKAKLSLHSMKPTELARVITETRGVLSSAKVNRHSKPSKNIRESRALRQKLAIAQTIMHEKELTHE